MTKKKILVVHGYSVVPLRSTVRDLLFSFEKHLDADVFYLNLFKLFKTPNYIKKIDFDIIVFHTTFLSARWNGVDYFNQKIIQKCNYFKSCNAVKIIMPQDEWIHTESLVKFINEIQIDIVFSVAPSTEWENIYKGVDFQKVKFNQILTGYIEDAVIEKVNEFKKEINVRDIDIGYRAYKTPPWLGKFGFLKTTISEVFKKEAPKKGFKIDISMEAKDTILGDNWYKFLLRSKFFIGVEGGSTVIDRDGSIWSKGTEYMKNNPTASFEEVERICFSGMDGNLGLICLSPRHLEACITETCQILIEGEYNGILKPGIHYIELKNDFSNLESVFHQMKDEAKVKLMIENAKKDVVESGKYSYKAMVEFIINESVKNCKTTKQIGTLKLYKWINKIEEKAKWKIFGIYSFLVKTYKKVKR